MHFQHDGRTGAGLTVDRKLAADVFRSLTHIAQTVAIGGRFRCTRGVTARGSGAEALPVIFYGHRKTALFESNLNPCLGGRRVFNNVVNRFFKDEE